MKFAKKVGTLTVIAASLFAAQSSSAAENDFINPEWANTAQYIGLGFGPSRAALNNSQINSAISNSGRINATTEDNRGFGGKLIAGKQLNRNLAVEFAYFDLGKFDYSASNVTGGTLSRHTSVRGGSLDLIGILPMSERISAYGRVGATYAMVRDNIGGNRAYAGDELRNKKFNPKVGVGLEYKLSEALALRGEVERYRITDGFRNRDHVNVASVSLIYKMGRPVAAPVVYVAPVVAAEPAPAPVVVQTPPPPPQPVSEKVSFAAESLFDFDKAVVKPAGKAALNELLGKLQGMDTEAMVSVGHADSVGSDAYNQKLSLRRAEAVKAYLVSKGVAPSRVFVEGKGESQPVADNKTAEGRAKNRRVIVEVVGSRSSK